MAERGTSASVLTEMAKGQNRLFHLGELYFDSATVYLTNYYRNIDWDNGTGSHSYLALGNYAGISNIEETAEFQVSQVTLQLSGIKTDLLSLFLREDYIDRIAKIFTGFMNNTDDIIVSPILIFQGSMDAPMFEEDPNAGSATLQITVTNQFVDFSRKSGRFTNDESQQFYYPGDKGLEFCSELILSDILWGRK